MESPLATVPQSPTDPGLSWGNQSFNEFLAKASLVSIANKDLSGDDEDCPENLWNIDVSNPNGPGWPCVSVDWVDRKRNAVPHTRPLPFPYALSYSATYNHDGDGYNITLPGQLCAARSSVVLDRPQGNCTEMQAYQRFTRLWSVCRRRHCFCTPEEASILPYKGYTML